MEEEKGASSISGSRTIAEMAEFWDSHDATDFEDETYKVSMEFDLQGERHYLAIDPDLLESLRERARARGINPESLANLWLQERVLTTTD